LFPYARQNAVAYLESTWETEATRNDVKNLIELSNAEFAKEDGIVQIAHSLSKEETLCRLLNNIHRWMDLDRKHTALKSLQGHIWRNAYECGAVKGHLYADAVPKMRELYDKGRLLYIYSSGSIEAQKLLFAHSVDGNVLNLFSGHFDTTTGLKTESESYRTIARTIGISPDRILFLTDIEREAYPAKEAGMRVYLVDRPGNAPLSESAQNDFVVIRTLDEMSV